MSRMSRMSRMLKALQIVALSASGRRLYFPQQVHHLRYPRAGTK
jgi:hypothetical protein